MLKEIRYLAYGRLLLVFKNAIGREIIIEKNTTKATKDKVLIDNLKILKLNKKSKKIRKSKDTFIIR